MWLISVTLDTSQFLIGPYAAGPIIEQSPLGDSLMHAPMALFSPTPDRGENANVECVYVLRLAKGKAEQSGRVLSIARG